MVCTMQGAFQLHACRAKNHKKTTNQKQRFISQKYATAQLICTSLVLGKLCVFVAAATVSACGFGSPSSTV